VGDIKAIVSHLRDRNIGVLITDHNVRETLDICDRGYIISSGNVIAAGSPATMALAARMSAAKLAVSNRLRLLDRAPAVAERVDRRELEMGHARALLGLTQRRQQIEVAQLVSKKGLSVRETEALVRRLVNKDGLEGGDTGGGGGGGSGRGKDPNVAALETRLAETLGAKVAIEHSGKSGKGRLVVAYNSLDELDGILEHIR
jgi:ParB family chromosome partitioning protein